MWVFRWQWHSRGILEVTGPDVDAGRIEELRRAHDRTNEVDSNFVAQSKLKLTAHAAECRGADNYSVTVPTPVDEPRRPHLRPLVAASKSVGQMIDGASRPMIVFESTVYPGVTEDVCGPLIEEASGLVRCRDFFLGYRLEASIPATASTRSTAS